MILTVIKVKIMWMRIGNSCTGKHIYKSKPLRNIHDIYTLLNIVYGWWFNDIHSKSFLSFKKKAAAYWVANTKINSMFLLWKSAGVWMQLLHKHQFPVVNVKLVILCFQVGLLQLLHILVATRKFWLISIWHYELLYLHAWTYICSDWNNVLDKWLMTYFWWK